MAVPKSVIKLKKGGIEYISSCDRVSYTIQELTRAALRDVGKLICRRCNEKAQTLPGMRSSKRVRGGSSAFQYWARRKECDLQVGIKHGTWYGAEQELGTSKQKKRAFLHDTAYENIAEIVKIESQYISAIESEAAALALIDEDDMQGGADEN